MLQEVYESLCRDQKEAQTASSTSLQKEHSLSIAVLDEDKDSGLLVSDNGCNGRQLLCHNPAAKQWCVYTCLVFC